MQHEGGHLSDVYTQRGHASRDEDTREIRDSTKERYFSMGTTKLATIHGLHCVVKHGQITAPDRILIYICAPAHKYQLLSQPIRLIKFMPEG